MQSVVQAVFPQEEVLRVVTGPARSRPHTVVQCLHITAGTKSLLAGTLQEDSGDAGIFAPLLQLRLQLVNHIQGERIERGGHVESYPDQLTRAGNQLLKLDGQNRHRYTPQLFFHSGLRFSRKALTPSRWSVVENNSTNRSRSPSRPLAITVSRPV